MSSPVGWAGQSADVVPISRVLEVAQTTAPLPSPLTIAISPFTEASAAAFDSRQRTVNRALPPIVIPSSGGVYHSNAVPPALSVIWMPAVGPAAVLVTELTEPLPSVVEATFSSALPALTDDAVSVR